MNQQMQTIFHHIRYKVRIVSKYTSEKIVDNTLLVDTTIIIGHDGSKTVAYNDYRDDLILELEKESQ